MKSDSNDNLRNEAIDPGQKLADLPVANAQAEDAKGGSINFAKIKVEYKEQKPDSGLA